MYKNYIKSIMDIIIGLSLLVIISPIMIVLIITGTLIFRANPFFIQERSGKNGKAFNIIKFRSMTGSVDDDCDELDRVNRYGKLIRRFSLDELPQVINVIKGEMSLIGPRPLLMDYNDLYNSDQLRRLLIKPGITGWAQVNGRNAISWEQRFNLDVWYVDNCTFILDVRIVAMTIIKALIRINVDSEDYQPIKPFTGSDNYK